MTQRQCIEHPAASPRVREVTTASRERGGVCAASGLTGTTVSDPERSADPFEQRLQLCTGKGGVGKSTIVAALAMEAARRGHRPLVVELGHRASMSAIFGSEKEIGYEPEPIIEGVWAASLEPEPALTDYVASVVRVRRVAELIASSEALRRFTEAAPAVTEVLALHRLRALLAQRREGEPRFHPVLVDLDSTGHALMFLGMPRMLDGLLSRSPLRALVRDLKSLLSDDATTCLHLVTLPGELPVHETLELYRELALHHTVSLGALFINAMPSDPWPDGDLDTLRQALAAARSAGLSRQADALALLYAEADEAIQSQTRARTLQSQVPLPSIVLPTWPGALSPGAVAALGTLASHWREAKA